MLLKQLALVSLSKKLTVTELTQTAAALQKQITRDLGPLWQIQATIDYFPDLQSVPMGYWPIVIMEDIRNATVAGFHTDKNHQPFSLVMLNNHWQLSCSHEMCEMLVDPFGSRLYAAGSQDTSPLPDKGKVNYLVEVCDPCEDASFAYSINGILVSDFYTVNYFDPQAVPGVRYSFTGAIQKPLEVKKNGYVSWQDPITEQWFQTNYFGHEVVTVPINGIKMFGSSLRSQMDRIVNNPNQNDSFYIANEKHAAVQKSVFKAGESMSVDWTREIGRVLQDKNADPRLAVAASNATANVGVTFLSGVGEVTIDVNGNSQTVTSSGSVSFDNINQGDFIEVDGMCTGSATVSIDLPTDKPPTVTFGAGPIHKDFLVL